MTKKDWKLVSKSLDPLDLRKYADYCEDRGKLTRAEAYRKKAFFLEEVLEFFSFRQEDFHHRNSFGNDVYRREIAKWGIAVGWGRDGDFLAVWARPGDRTGKTMRSKRGTLEECRKRVMELVLEDFA